MHTHLHIHHNKAFANLLGALLCALPVLAALSPRGLAFAPILWGLIAFIGHRAALKSWLPLSKPYLISLGGFWLLAASCVLWGYDSEAITLERASKILPIFIGIVLSASAAYHLRKDLLPFIQRFFPVGCMLGLAIVITNLYADSAVYRALQTTQTVTHDGNLSHLNRSVVAVSFMSLIAAGFMVGSMRARWPIFLALMVALVAALVQTHSQSIQLSVILFFISAAILPYRWRAFWVILAAIVSILLLSAPFLAQFLFSHVADASTQFSWLKHGYAAPRMEIWDFIARRALDRPWLGHGIEATRTISDFDIAHIYHHEEMILHPHNFAMQIWIEFGLLGALCASAFFTLIFRAIWRNGSIAYKRLQTSLLISALASASISYGLWQSWWLGLWGIAASLLLLVHEPQENSQHTT